VTLETILGGGSVNLARVLSGLLVRMAFEAERRYVQSLQIHSRRANRDSKEMTGLAPHGNWGMHVFSFCLVLVTLDALSIFGIPLELNRVDTRKGARHRNREE
jgi:hypothetical protein